MSGGLKYALLLIILFLGAFFLGLNSVGDSSIKNYSARDSSHGGEQQTARTQSRPSSQSSPQAQDSSPQTQTSSRNKDGTIATIRFLKRLHGSSKLEEITALFEEVFPESAYSWYATDIMRVSLMEKWGELAPLQGLESLEGLEALNLTYKNGRDYTPALFSGWARKDPEAALAFYTEHYKDADPEKSQAILSSIMSSYAAQSPQEALAWLALHKDSLAPDVFKHAHNACLLSRASNAPSSIPDLVKTMDSEDLSEKIYGLGYAWGASNAESREWIDALAPEQKAKAEAGRIMALSQGDLGQIKETLATMPPERRAEIARELADKVFHFGGLDLHERIDWIAESLPSSEIPEDLKSSIGSWLRRDIKDGTLWMESLPEGASKNLLEECYEKTKPLEIRG